MQTVWQDLRFGARMLLKNPGVTAVAVITLALGIGANTAIFSVVNAVVLRPLPYPNANRLVALSENSLEATTSRLLTRTISIGECSSRSLKKCRPPAGGRRDYR